MKYRLYVSGFSNETRSFAGKMSIGGVILKDNDYEKVFSRDIGRGSIIEAHIYGIIYGINEVSKDENVSSLTVYSTNLMIVNYLNSRNIRIPERIEGLIENLIKSVEDFKFEINYEYFEVSDYTYVRSLAEEALKV